MDSDPTAAPAESPLACTLGPDDGAARLRRWQLLAKKSPPRARRSGNTLEVRWQLQAGVKDELEALAAAERQCCSFAEWTVTQEEDHVVLHVRADPGRADDIAIFAALFRAD
jgi:hypothetical protein